MVKAWTVRSGRFGDRDAWAVENAMMGGGWDQIPDLTPIETREQMQELATSVWGSSNPGAVPNYTGQLWAIRSSIQPGDLAVLPLKTTSQIALGWVTGGYEYLASEPDPSRRHILRVDWRRTDVPRTALKQDLLHILGSALTVFQSSRNDAVWRLEQVLQTVSDPGSRVAQGAAPNEDEPEVEADSIFDIEEYARTRVQTLIQENFAGHDLTRLIAAILTCEGFICELKPPGADGGVDILAGRGPLGLDSPRLVVQVKSEPSPVGDPVVQTLQGALTRFNADQALLVAWGGVNKYAEKFLETTKFTIRVWDSDDIMDALFRTYQQLPEDIRSELPLQQIWVAVS